ncbi:MAG: hypothetical protein QM770_07930 [Tepidisphaeraceae bacterium]
MQSGVKVRVWASCLTITASCICPGAAGETIGSPLQQRQFKDGDTGQVYVYAGTSSPFNLDGVASTWSFYDANTFNGIVTPLLFKKLSGSRYELTGIGTSRTSSATGAQTFPFAVIAGSAAIAGGSYTFGFTNRSYVISNGNLLAAFSSSGVVSYDHPGVNVPTDDWLMTANLTTGGPVSLSIGSVVGSGGIEFYNSPAGGRVYSANFTAVPEPVAMSLVGAMAVTLRARRPVRIAHPS